VTPSATPSATLISTPIGTPGCSVAGFYGTDSSADFTDGEAYFMLANVNLGGTVMNVTLQMSNPDNNQMQVALYADNGGNPGALLATSDVVPVPNAGSFTMNLNGGLGVTIPSGVVWIAVLGTNGTGTYSLVASGEIVTDFEYQVADAFPGFATATNEGADFGAMAVDLNGCAVTPTFTPSVTSTQTPNGTFTATPSSSASPTTSPTFTSSETANGTFTASPTCSPTYTATPTASATGTDTDTSTVTPTSTNTPTPIATIAIQVTPGASSPISLSLSFTSTSSSTSETSTVAAQVVVAPNAFSTPVTLSMQVYDTNVAPAPDISTFTVLGATYQISATDANGYTIEPSAGSTETLVFPYNPADLNGENPLDLEVSYYNGASWTSLTGTVNTAADTITVTTNHFSIWAVSLKTHATPVVPASETGRVAFGPVPAKQGDPLRIFFDKAPASGSFQVYNVAGERVAEDSFGSSGDSLRTASLAPGIYLARIVVSYQDGSSRTVLQKIIIVR
jgi:hypothetical protein